MLAVDLHVDVEDVLQQTLAQLTELQRMQVISGSVETLHWTNRPEILNKHRQKPMGKL